MTRIAAMPIRSKPVVGWCAASLIGLCLGLSGCHIWEPRKEPPVEDPGKECRTFRKPDRELRFSGLSNKARDIERDLGAN